MITITVILWYSNKIRPDISRRKTVNGNGNLY